MVGGSQSSKSVHDADLCMHRHKLSIDQSPLSPVYFNIRMPKGVSYALTIYSSMTSRVIVVYKLGVCVGGVAQSCGRLIEVVPLTDSLSPELTFLFDVGELATFAPKSPIFGLIWKISVITSTSLFVLPLFGSSGCYQQLPSKLSR